MGVPWGPSVSNPLIAETPHERLAIMARLATKKMLADGTLVSRVLDYAGKGRALFTLSPSAPRGDYFTLPPASGFAVRPNLAVTGLARAACRGGRFLQPSDALSPGDLALSFTVEARFVSVFG